MTSTVLLNCSAVLLDSNPVANILVENGEISRITNQKIVADDVIDLTYLTLFPGFVDIHNHGAMGIDVNMADDSGFQEISKFLTTQGVTSWVPTLVPDSVSVYERTIEAMESWRENEASKNCAEIVGVHYEGIFANKVCCGALRPEYFRVFTGTELDDLPLLSNGKHMTTMAPEIEGGIDVIKKFVESGWTVSIGHTMASYDILQQAVFAGATHMTHFFNAMTGLDHRGEGVALWGLLDQDVSFDIIADGIHVNPLMLKFAITVKSPDMVTLISDSVAPTGLGDGEFELWGNRLTVKDGETANAEGTLSGSVITMLDAFRQMRSLGFSNGEIARMTSGNPAKVIGIDDKVGSIELGKRANFVGINPEGEVKFVMMDGNVVYSEI